MSDNQQPSSASALANSAAGAVREGVAKVTGNPYDSAAADKKKGDFLVLRQFLRGAQDGVQWVTRAVVARIHDDELAI